MCEESACLVPPLDHQSNGPSESQLSYNGNASSTYTGDALVGFHEDALSKAAIGKAQLLLTMVLGLALAADCSEIQILSYLLPVAELRLCIDDHRKGWLISITLLAMALGSFAWGVLADHLGRKRALISALSVAALFSTAATVMPTYGTFMTARFCSGLGVAGAFPISFSYLAETCSRKTRSCYAALLFAFWPMGAVYTSLLAYLTLPSTGAEIVEDNREHWSAWHRFLLLSILPTLGCIIGLIWASESPRYLLEASREVEALEVYQRLHRLNKTKTQYGLTELELPGRNAYRDRLMSPSGTAVGHGFASLKASFQRILSPTHFYTTLLLAALHLLVGFTEMGITSFSESLVRELRKEDYYSRRTTVHDGVYKNNVFNTSIENTLFNGTLFKNVTFKHINFNHVEFSNCSFEDTEFINVKSSISFFERSTIKFCRFVDTDLTDHHFVNCSLYDNTFVSLISDCIVDFDYNVYFYEKYKITLIWSVLLSIFVILSGILVSMSRKFFIVSKLLLITFLSTLMFHFTKVVVTESMSIWIKMGLQLILYAVTVVVIESYPCYVRCTAHGIMRCLYHLASLCSIPIYNMLLHTMLLFPAVLTISLSGFAALLSTTLHDNWQTLM